MFYLHSQSSSASRQPKGWTQSSTNSIFLLEKYQFFVGKYSTFIYNPTTLLESYKIPTLSVSPTFSCTQSTKRSKRDTKKIFTGHYRTRSSNN